MVEDHQLEEKQGPKTGLQWDTMQTAGVRCVGPTKDVPHKQRPLVVKIALIRPAKNAVICKALPAFFLVVYQPSLEGGLFILLITDTQFPSGKLIAQTLTLVSSVTRNRYSTSVR